MTVPRGFERIREAGVIAVVRADRPKDAVRVAGALLEGGVWAIELTFTTPGAAEALAEARQVYGAEMLLGAGTIREPAQIEAAVRAGVDFMVTSHLRADVLEAMLATGLPVMPGVFTPTEVGQALDAGAQAVKLFPASTAGTGHLRALRGPFPGLQVVPTGGIDAADIGPWFLAGALAVGAGSELVPRSALQAGDWDEISRRAERFAEATRAARETLER
jgi:2-dehydro-3-deoxyphosphogluconate aldolase/(4S)-4-hydroxy-2-oxoglutarate aldolase